MNGPIGERPMPLRHYLVTASEQAGHPCHTLLCGHTAVLVVSTANASPDSPWLCWCLEHWPVLYEVLKRRGHVVEYSAKASLVISEAIGSGTAKLTAVPSETP
jgi:hypothetical protein